MGCGAGRENALRCDARCSALRWAVQRIAWGSAARCVLAASHVRAGRRLACVAVGWGLGGFRGLVERVRRRDSRGIRSALSFG